MLVVAPRARGVEIAGEVDDRLGERAAIGINRGYGR